jgi:uncharacterized LabA/DUF88 family protein
MRPGEAYVTDQRFAALLVDFENLYYFIRNRPDYQSHDTMALIVRLIQDLREHLINEYKEQTIILDAYADFERIEESAQGDLYLLGFDTHNVLGTDHKNAADMKLCIDAMDILYTRPEITAFILIAGDRDYIPVIQHLKRKAKTVRVVGFQGSVSGDLLTTLGERFFIDGQKFLSVTSAAITAKPLSTPLPSAAVNATPKAVPQPTSPGTVPGTPLLPTKSPEEYRTIALALVFKFFKDKPEIWMTPFLHRLRAELPELSESDRKSIISSLNASGAITVEQRQGEMHEFTVFKLNWNHAEVRKLNG